MAIELTTENYGEVAASKLPVLIDFGAEWCGPCRMVAPIVEELAGEYEGRVLICTCDAEKSDDIVATYKVRNIPTLVFLKEGPGGRQNRGCDDQGGDRRQIVETALSDDPFVRMAWDAGRGVHQAGLHGLARSVGGGESGAAGPYAIGCGGVAHAVGTGA